MEIILMALALLVGLDLVAMRYGFTSRDNIDSPEWERLHQWRAFH